MEPRTDFESVAVSSRIRLARNFKDYPFPARLMADRYAEEQANEMIQLISAELTSMEEFHLYEMKNIAEQQALLLQERYLISRDLMRHRAISAAVISEDESISVMINEEDHIRAQYFIKGFELGRAYERIAGIEEIISDSIPFAYDEELGYLTACPTNLGTGLRASVMLFLPALSRRGRMRSVIAMLTRVGLTVRGVFGEGSGAQGDLFQVSNEVTLGFSEKELLDIVENSVKKIVTMEIYERKHMMLEEGRTLKDRIFRAYGLLTNCKLLDEREFTRLISDVKLGITLGLFDKMPPAKDDRLEQLDELVVAVRPTGMNVRSGSLLTGEDQSAFRAEYVSKALRDMRLA